MVVVAAHQGEIMTVVEPDSLWELALAVRAHVLHTLVLGIG